MGDQLTGVRAAVESSLAAKQRLLEDEGLLTRTAADIER